MLRVFRKFFGARQIPQPVQRIEDSSIARKAQLEKDIRAYKSLLVYTATLKANSLSMPQRFFPYVPSSNPLIRPVREPERSWQY